MVDIDIKLFNETQHTIDDLVDLVRYDKTWKQHPAIKAFRAILIDERIAEDKHQSNKRKHAADESKRIAEMAKRESDERKAIAEATARKKILLDKHNILVYKGVSFLSDLEYLKNFTLDVKENFLMKYGEVIDDIRVSLTYDSDIKYTENDNKFRETLAELAKTDVLYGYEIGHTSNDEIFLPFTSKTNAFAEKIMNEGKMTDELRKIFSGFVSIDISPDFFDIAPDEMDYIIEDLIPVDSIGEMFGKSQALKSFVTLDMCFCIAHGIPFHDKAVKQGKIVYVAAEGQASVKMRVMALAERYGVELDTDMFKVITSNSFDLLNMDISPFASDRYADSQLVVIDTLVRAAKGMSLMIDGHWTKVLANIETHIQPFTKSVMWLAHPPKGKDVTAAGIADRFNASDFVFHIVRKLSNDLKTTLTIDKMKDGETGSKIVYKFMKHGKTLVPFKMLQANSTDKAIMEILKTDSCSKKEFNDAVEKFYEGKDKTDTQIRAQRIKILKRLEDTGGLEITA